MTPQEQFQRNHPAIEAWLQGEDVEYQTINGDWYKYNGISPNFTTRDWRVLKTEEFEEEVEDVKPTPTVEERLAQLELSATRQQEQLDHLNKRTIRLDKRIEELENSKPTRPIRWRKFSEEKPERWPVCKLGGPSQYIVKGAYSIVNQDTLWAYPEEIGL